MPPALPLIVLCVGTDAWLREEALRGLAARGLAPGSEALDRVVFESAETEPAAILAAARTPPFASPRRLVIVRGLLGTAREALEWLADYAKQPTASTCLIVEMADAPTGAAAAALRGVAQVIACQPLKGGAAVAWVRQRMTATHRKTITPDAASALVARLGPDLSTLAQTLERLALAVGPRPHVTGQDVVALVGWSVEERVFTVVDAAIRGDRATALRVTRRLLEEEGVAPEELLGALGKHLRRLWQAAAAVEAGRSPEAALQAAGVPWHAQHPFRALLARVRRPAATAALEALVETDRQLKTGGAPAGALVEPFVWALAAPLDREVTQAGTRGLTG